MGTPAVTTADPIRPGVHEPPSGRAFFADERGIVLRSTWYTERGFLNLSIWKDATCVATFHLQVADVARFTSFLVEGLGRTATEAVSRRTTPEPASGAGPSAGPDVVSELTRATRAVVAAGAGSMRRAWRSRRAT
jgi:hypothetical protein